MKLGKALIAGEAKYQQLHAKYEALRSGVINDILGVSDAPKTTVESYILVLVDAQSHQVCPRCALNISRLILAVVQGELCAWGREWRYEGSHPT